MKPVVLVILDGVGIGKHDAGDAVFHANTPNLDRLLATCPHVQLKAHGTAVGLPSDGDMGNSEVGQHPRLRSGISSRSPPGEREHPVRRAV